MTPQSRARILDPSTNNPFAHPSGWLGRLAGWIMLWTNKHDDVLRVLGTFSASTVVSTFEIPFEENGPQVVVIGSPVPVAGYLEEAVAA